MSFAELLYFLHSIYHSTDTIYIFVYEFLFGDAEMFIAVSFSKYKHSINNVGQLLIFVEAHTV